MTTDAYSLSTGVFARGLTNLQSQLRKAEQHAASSGSGEATLLDARLATEESAQGAATASPNDVHMFTLAAQVHWAAEGARLAIANLLGAPAIPSANVAKSFAELHQQIDTTTSYLRDVAPGDLEAGLDRTIVLQRPRGSVSSSGAQFLLAYAIPHFFYHVTAAYTILRNQGVAITMGDFLGNWGTT